MKLMSAMVLAAIVAVNAAAAERERVVAICVDGGNAGISVNAAGKLASGIFAEIGVRTEWHLWGACPSPVSAIRITFSEETAKTQLPGAFAYALPYEETHIVVFSDRVASKHVPRLLAYVLAHEIAHILQNINRHSDSGIMKANWDGRDYFHIRSGRLGFTPLDIDLIHLGMDRREAHRAGTPLAESR